MERSDPPRPGADPRTADPQAAKDADGERIQAPAPSDLLAASDRAATPGQPDDEAPSIGESDSRERPALDVLERDMTQPVTAVSPVAPHPAFEPLHDAPIPETLQTDAPQDASASPTDSSDAEADEQKSDAEPPAEVVFEPVSETVPEQPAEPPGFEPFRFDVPPPLEDDPQPAPATHSQPAQDAEPQLEAASEGHPSDIGGLAPAAQPAEEPITVADESVAAPQPEPPAPSIDVALAGEVWPVEVAVPAAPQAVADPMLELEAPAPAGPALAAPVAAVSAAVEPVSFAAPSLASVADAGIATAPAPARDYRGLAVRVLKFAFIAFSGWLIAVLILIGVFRFVNPPFSMLMAQQWMGGTSIDRRWVPLERISPNLVRAVVVAEDGRFCSHMGIDLIEAAEALRRRAADGYPRGASTISMQLTKNLFLLPVKSYIRKAVEIPLTIIIELAWPKARILEVYLNIVEWGPGVFGAEAAAQTHFKRPAAAITPRQAAQLAVVLPNPIVRNAGKPGPRTAKRASLIQTRAARARGAANCVLDAR